MRTARSASRTWSACSSAVEYTATASIPSSCSARITRTAISPRFATRTRSNIERPAVQRLELEQQLAVLHGLGIANVDLADDAFDLRLDLVHQLHRLEDAEGLSRRNGIAFLDERRRTGLWAAVEGADHRAFDADEPVRGRWWRARGCGSFRHRSRLLRHGGRLRRLADADAHAFLFDRDLADLGLLHDADELADTRRASLVDAAGRKRRLAARPLSDRAEQRLGLAAVEREQQQLLLARGEPVRVVAQGFEVGLGLFVRTVAEQLDGPLEPRVDRGRRVPEAPANEVAKLVDDRRVAIGAEDVDERLRGDDLSDRCGERRRSRLLAHAVDLVEHFVEATVRTARPQLRVDRRDDPDRDLALRGTDRDAGHEPRHRHIADVLVDDVGRPPERVRIDFGVEPDTLERRRSSLRRDSMDGEGDRVHGAGDQIGPGPRRLDRRGQRVAARSLAVEARRQTRELTQLGDELPGAVWLKQTGRVVEEQPRRTHLEQPTRRVEERLVAVAAIEEAGIELAPCRVDRLGRLAQVVGVVQGIVQPEHVDAAVGGGLDEAPRELAADRARADEEPAAHGERKRGGRPRLERSDPLPRALHAALHGAVEDTAAGDLEVREARPVEHARELEQRRGRHGACERLLAEHANRRIDELRHDAGP